MNYMVHYNNFYKILIKYMIKVIYYKTKEISIVFSDFFISFTINSDIYQFLKSPYFSYII